ncbi:hypothetical protein PAAG_04359 [Paracoccidioides lutzii Pb01]|uniref:Uncharacterized protein n=1 Tax=Paracoccidioides lutzii (strain ATCC MYA-826 / Pb01) TaxID=502779 RepID=C1H0R5_PARBA|nr:hypothetical protein PAAG_04359 [Paracoccidioides lutzii Pb01]EEH33309.2 hypothetical protein PAAG_04359 [Paracoccidioides lutzii Pb01]
MTLEGESDNYQWTNMHKILIPLHDMMKSISILSSVPPEIFQMTINEVCPQLLPSQKLSSAPNGSPARSLIQERGRTCPECRSYFSARESRGYTNTVVSLRWRKIDCALYECLRAVTPDFIRLGILATWNRLNS